MKTWLLMLILITIAAILAIPQKSFAAANCQPIYGGGETCTSNSSSNAFGVDITVLNPVTNTFIDNLGATDPAYKAGNIITFQIKATNNSAQPISQVTITNTLPEFVTYSTSPGSYNPTTRQISLISRNLAPNQEQKFTIIGRIAAQNQLPANLSLICRNAEVAATTSDNKTAQDTAQFCIQVTSSISPSPITNSTGGLRIAPPSQAQTTPPTGSDTFSSVGLLVLGITGFYVRKKSTKIHDKGESSFSQLFQ